MAKLPDKFFDKAAKPPATCSVCDTGLFFKHTTSWFSPGIFELTGELICMKCIREHLKLNGLLGSRRESEEPE